MKQHTIGWIMLGVPVIAILIYGLFTDTITTLKILGFLAVIAYVFIGIILACSPN